MPWEVKTEADYNNAARDIQKHFEEMAETVETTTVQAVAHVALDCLSRAVLRAPVDLGPLRGSGYANVNGVQIAHGLDDKSGRVQQTGQRGVTQGDTVTAEIGFSEKYAFVQHEHSEFNHPEGGQDHYLSSVVEEEKEHWIEYMRNAAANAIKGAFK